MATATALSLVAASGVGALFTLRRFPGASPYGAQSDDRGRFMAVLGASLSGLFLVVLGASAVPRFSLDPCL